MRTSRSILALVAAGAAAFGCAKSQSVGTPYGSYGGSGGTAGAGAGGSTGGTGPGGTGAGGSTGGTGAGGSTGGTGAGGSTGGTGAGGSGGGNCTPPVAGGACDTSPQCGCNSGQACVVVDQTTGSTGCVAAGTIQPAQNCSSGTCVAGYDCVGSACKKYCDSASDCGGGQDCVQVSVTNSSGTSTPIPSMKVCTSGCALENPGAVCGSGLNCYQSSQTSSATDCGPGGSGTGANGCSSADATTCAPGYVCLTDNSCAHWCRVGMSDCLTGSCGNLQTPPVINGVTYGICQ